MFLELVPKILGRDAQSVGGIGLGSSGLAECMFDKMALVLDKCLLEGQVGFREDHAALLGFRLLVGKGLIHLSRGNH